LFCNNYLILFKPLFLPAINKNPKLLRGRIDKYVEPIRSDATITIAFRQQSLQPFFSSTPAPSRRNSVMQSRKRAPQRREWKAPNSTEGVVNQAAEKPTLIQ